MELERTRTGVEAKLFELSQQIVKDSGYQLYDVEYVTGSSTLKVFIMNPETKTAVIDDCIKVDRAFNPYCETEDWIPNDFILEVSSPGIYRAIRNRDHFEQAKDEYVLCVIQGNLRDEQVEHLPKSLKGAKKFRGELKEIKDKNIVLKLEDYELSLDFEQIKKASLDPSLNG